MRRSAERLHWALLLVDFINPLDFTKDRLFIQRALRAAQATARLKTRLKRSRTPVTYANDHWGAWTESLDALIATLASAQVPSRKLAEILAPEPNDYLILKPRHSAFFGTPLEFLLEELNADSLVITGIAVDNCVLFTASDAYVRQFKLWVPANCVVAERDAHRLAALSHMRRILKARITAA